MAHYAVTKFSGHALHASPLQEARRRGLLLRWTSVKLSDVGLSVCASIIISICFPCLLPLCCRLSASESFFWLCGQTSRFRTGCIAATCVVSKSLLHCPSWQELLHGWEVDVNGPWNAAAEMPLHKWLQTTQSEEDRQRLLCMGNIVVPLQAAQGFTTLSRMHI